MRASSWSAWGAALVVGSLASHAWAQRLDRASEARRRELIDRATAASDAGRHDEALDLLERAGTMRMSPSLRRFIADEENARGHLVASLGAAHQCIHDEQADPHAVNHDADLAACETLAASLEGRVGHVIVEVPAPTPAGLQISVAGGDIPRALWGVRTAVDPGTLAVDASALDRRPFHETRTVGPGETVTVRVSLEDSTRTDVGSLGGGSSSTPGTETETPAVTPQGHGPSVGTIIGGIAFGVAGASLVVGIVGNVLWQTNANAFDDRSNPAVHECSVHAGVVTGTSTCQSEYDTSNVGQVLTIAGYAGAGALTVLGLVLVLTSGRSHDEHTRAGFGCSVAPDGVSCAGRF